MNSNKEQLLPCSDAVFPGFLEFPGIGKFLGIGPNFPGIPGNLKQAVLLPYLECSTVNLHLKHPFKANFRPF